MDTTKIKAILSQLLGQLSLLRNYSKLLLPAVIALVAVILMIVAPMMGRGLRRQIQSESLDMANQISRLSDQGISRDQWRIAQQRQEAFAADANSIENLTLQTTKRPLLSYGIFPEPSDESVYLFRDFGIEYRRSIDRLFDNANAGLAPSRAELDRHLGRSGTGTGGRSRGDQEETIIDLVSQQRAQSLSFYADLQAMPGYNFWQDYRYQGLAQGVSDSWRSQLSYWIIEDIMETVSAINAPWPNVLDAPVKRILRIDFAGGSGQRMSGARDSRELALAKYVKDQSEWLAPSFTGQASDSEVDVVHFRVELLIDAGQVIPFIRELKSAKTHTFAGWDGNQEPQQFHRNQITLLRSSQRPIERDAEEHRHYRYGQSGVVRLELVCEYLFFGEAYEDIKPDVEEDDSPPQDSMHDDFDWF